MFSFPSDSTKRKIIFSSYFFITPKFSFQEENIIPLFCNRMISPFKFTDDQWMQLFEYYFDSTNIWNDT